MRYIQLIILLGLAIMLPACGGFGPGYTDFHAPLSHGYSLTQFSGHDVVIHPDSNWNDKTEVPSFVSELGFDDKFILAKQQLMDARELHPLGGKFQYWIIDAPSHQRHGPFTEDEFINKRKELKVSDKIVLKGNDSYRP